MPSSRNTIYIYNGPGVSPGAVPHTTHTLRSIANYAIKPIGPEDVRKGEWTKDAALFVLPGGASTPYHEALSPIGNDVLRQYVSNGGSFLGICAGAYYCGATVEFGKGTSIQVFAKRDLGFFPGCIEGPTLKPYAYDSHRGACAAEIQMTDGSKSLKVYYNGGGHFLDVETYLQVRVLANYHTGQAAIVHIPHGKGNVTLSGPHWEYSPTLLEESLSGRADPHIDSIITTLRLYEDDRLTLVRKLLEGLGLETLPATIGLPE